MKVRQMRLKWGYHTLDMSVFDGSSCEDSISGMLERRTDLVMGLWTMGFFGQWESLDNGSLWTLKGRPMRLNGHARMSVPEMK